MQASAPASHSTAQRIAREAEVALLRKPALQLTADRIAGKMVINRGGRE